MKTEGKLISNEELFKELQAIKKEQAQQTKAMKLVIEALMALTTELDGEEALDGIDLEKLKQLGNPGAAYQ